MDDRQQVFTTGMIAKICQVATRTVIKWFDSGQLKGYRVPGSKDRRVPRVCLVEFLANNEMAFLLEDHERKIADAWKDAVAI